VKHKLPISRDGRRAAVVGGCLLALAATPLAFGFGEGSPVKGGARNPSTNASLSYNAQTEIIANNNSYGTRQSNKGTGGGAIYGCRAPVGGPACLSGVNLNKGLAFSFSSSGNVGGTISLANPNGAPFTTNAKGVATGLNANYLQGYQASAFQLASKPVANATTAANATNLGGQPASYYLPANSVLFAYVSPTGALGTNRGAVSAGSAGSPNFFVTFNSNVSGCSFTASPVGGALTGGQLGVASAGAANANTVYVYVPTVLNNTANGSPAPASAPLTTSPATLPPGGFDLQVNC
jgi:hypothetical protein